MSGFPEDVFLAVQYAKGLHGPIHSTHEALGVILEEFEEFKSLVFQKHPDLGQMRRELVQLAAMCQRAADDLGLPSSLEPTNPIEDWSVPPLG